MATYTCFTRSWWRWEYRNGKKELVPNPGARRTAMQTFTGKDALEKARDYCEQWNNTHNPGPLCRKCEFASNF